MRWLLPLLLLAAALWWTYAPRKPPPNVGFYYWKTRWDPTPALLARARNAGAQRLYLRLFDIRWDRVLQETVPVSPLRVAAPLPPDLEIVPVVYITNEAILRENKQKIFLLAERTHALINQIAQANGLKFRELQIDCDWTDSSRTNYFQFLRRLGESWHAYHVLLSATIRLHQIKYFPLTGIPPVARGMVMFYNFGPIRADAPRSSIFNATDARRYSPYLAKYPLPLDLSLPLFSWLIHSQNGHVVGLLEKATPLELATNPAFRLLSPKTYVATRSLFFQGRYFREGDHVNIETSGPENTQTAAQLAERGMSPERFGTVAFFDLDEVNMQEFSHENLTSILRPFR